MGKNWKTRTTTPRAPSTASRPSGVLHRTGMVCLTESPHLATCGARRSRTSRAIRRMAISKTLRADFFPEDKKTCEPCLRVHKAHARWRRRHGRVHDGGVRNRDG
jgi:hypothetical protein